MQHPRPGLPTPAHEAQQWAILGMVGSILVAGLWVATLMTGAEIGPAVYFEAPLLVAAGVITAGGCTILRGDDRSVLLLLSITTFGLQLNFRVRHGGESGLDWQNGIKVVVWTIMLTTAIPYRRAIAALIAKDIGCKLAFAFCCFATVSTLWSADPAVTAASAIGLCATFCFASIVALRLTSLTFHRVLFWGLGAEILLGLAAYVVVPSLALMEPSEGETKVRLQGLSGHPNLLGQQAAILVIAALAMRDAKAVSRIWLGMIGAAATIALIGSDSRTSLAAVIAAWGVVRLRSSGYWRAGLAAAVLVVSVGAFLAATDTMPDASTLFGEVSRSGSASEISTLTGRTELWAIAWEHFLRRPFVGWGYNGNERLMVNSVGANFVGNPVNAHNLFLQSLMTLGSLGSLTVFGFLGALCWSFVRYPEVWRDRFLVFLLVLGVAEAEFLTLPMIMIFLGFWCVARAAIQRLAPDSTAEAAAWRS